MRLKISWITTDFDLHTFCKCLQNYGKKYYFSVSRICIDEENVLTEKYLGFSVYLSNTTDKEEGILCFRDNSYTRATLPNIVNISCPYYGRYVICYNNRTHSPYPAEYSKYVFTFLCEVEVYGENNFTEETRMLYRSDYLSLIKSPNISYSLKITRMNYASLILNTVSTCTAFKSIYFFIKSCFKILKA